MNTIVAKFKIQPGKEAEAEEAMKKQVSAVESGEAGVITYIFHRSAKDPLEVTVFEVYRDDEAVAAHRSAPHQAAFGALFGTVFDTSTVEIRRLERVAGFSR